jgi:hypothetical protein
MQMSAQAIEAKPVPKKLLVRMIPGMPGKIWAYRGAQMKSGVYHKADESVCRLLLQRKYTDGRPRFEVDTLRSAMEKLKREHPDKNPRTIIRASELVGFESLEDERMSASNAFRNDQAIGFDALYDQAVAGGLHMEVEDQEFLQRMVEDGQTIKTAGESRSDARLDRMEKMVMQLVQSREVGPNQAQHGKAEDLYDTKAIVPDPAPSDDVTDEEFDAAAEEMEVFSDDLPDKIDMEQSLAQAEAAELEEFRAKERSAEIAKLGKKKATKKKAPTKKATKKISKKEGRRRRGVPKLGK